MPDLKLIALDADDLAVISAHMQDAVLHVGDMAYLKREMRFAIVANRFDWLEASQASGEGRFERRATGLRFERVLDAQIQGIDLTRKNDCLALLAISFETVEAPAGYVTLHFSGSGAVRLHVECIEAELKDLGIAWRTRCKPEHAPGDPDATV